MRPTNRKTVASLLPAVAVAASVMAAGVAGNAIGTYVNGAPQVGHIIAFEPSRAADADAGGRLVVHRRDKSDCVLDLGTLHRFGGSLVVESKVAGDTAGFRVHWAGQHTSDGAGDCGADAILIAGRQDLDLLAASAGGYQTAQNHATLFDAGVLKAAAP